MPKFDLDDPAVSNFIDFLMSLDGKSRQDKAARAIVSDVSKVLKFIHSRKASFLSLLDAENILKFMDHLKSESLCGAEGQCTKLDNVLTTLKYVQIRLCNTASQTQQCLTTTTRVKEWRQVLHREKAYLTTLCMQERGDGGELLQVQQFLSGVEQRVMELLTKAMTVTLTPGKDSAVVG